MTEPFIINMSPSEEEYKKLIIERIIKAPVLATVRNILHQPRNIQYYWMEDILERNNINKSDYETLHNYMMEIKFGFYGYDIRKVIKALINVYNKQKENIKIYN